MDKTGMVTLVGAGPGDPGLLTLAGREALLQAEVVLYDRLVGEEILSLIPPTAKTVPVGKSKGDHSLPQGEINRLLVEYALAGKNLVRLKGGDPYLFGRGAEEVEALRGRGIPFRVIPGVTSAVAAPAYAGIPVTHREHASSLHIVTGHGQDGRRPDIRYRELAALGGTLVFMMGFSRLAEICRDLVAAGLPETTPAAVIENGTTSRQRRLTATVGDLPERAGAMGFHAPAIVVVGAVCGLGDRFSWLEYLPLWGKRFLAVSTQATGGRIADKLRPLGCGVDELACLRTEPLALSEHFWRTVNHYDWVVLTSPYGATLFLDNLLRHGIDVRSLSGMRFAVVGRRTADALAARGIIADFMPETFTGRALGKGLIEAVRQDARLLVYRARDGNEDLVDLLSEKGMAYDEVAAYVTLPAKGRGVSMVGALRDGQYDAVLLTSASAANAFADLVDSGTLGTAEAVCIGPATEAAAREHGMRTGVAANATLDDMVEYIVKKWGTNHGNDPTTEKTAEK